MIRNEDGVLRITDGPVLVYDSSVHKLLHYLAPRIDGSVVRSSGVNYPSSGNWRVRSADFQINTLPPEATDIVGMVRVTFPSGFTNSVSYLPDGAWFPAGGSILLAFKSFQTISGSWGNHPSSIGVATIYKSGTELRFREQIRFNDHRLGALGYRLPPYTLEYRVFPAVFS